MSEAKLSAEGESPEPAKRTGDTSILNPIRVSHPEISEEIRPEHPLSAVSDVTPTASRQCSKDPVPPEISIAGATMTISFSHPELPGENNPEDTRISANSVEESVRPEVLVIAAGDPKVALISDPEISEANETEPLDEKVSREISGTVSQPHTFVEFRPDAEVSHPIVTTFSHPEITKELGPEDICISAVLETVSMLTEPSAAPFQPAITVTNRVRSIFTHPEISEKMKRPEDTSSTIGISLPAVMSQSNTSSATPGQTETTVTDRMRSSFTHPEISEKMKRPDNTTSTIAISVQALTSQSNISSAALPPDTTASIFTPEVSEKMKQPQDTSSTVAISVVTALTSCLDTSSDGRLKIETCKVAETITSEEVDPQDHPSTMSTSENSASSRSDSACLTLQTTASQPEFSQELRPEVASPASGIPATTDSQIVYSRIEVNLPGELPSTIFHEILSEETHSAAPAAGSAGAASFATPLATVTRTDSSRADRKAILDALARKTVCRDAIFDPVILSNQGERKYVSDIAPARNTTTDYSTDSVPALTPEERQDLIESAARRTVVQFDSSLSPFRVVDVGVQAVVTTDPASSSVVSEAEKVAYVEGTPKLGLSGSGSSPTVILPAAVSQHVSGEVRSTMVPSEERRDAINVKPQAQVIPEVTEPLAISPDDRKDVINVLAKTKVSQDATMVVAQQERKYLSDIQARKTITDHTKDSAPISSTERKGLIDAAGRKTVVPNRVVPAFPVEPPLMPFSKKERRELVRSISKKIQEPDTPLWGMDLMDIREAEEAERTHNPPPTPYLDFEEPVRPKVPLRRSKRHRIVRVHATEYARAHAVEVQEFCTNKIKSTKYTLMSFLPMNLFFQFMRAANLYFILIAALQLIPDFSPTSWWTTVAPLCFVLLLNAVKEGVDEFKRSISDRTVNKQTVEVLNENSFFETRWSSVIVGDIVRVKSDKEFPADLVFLSSADVKGLAYVETANLDGETNLKIRNAFYKGAAAGTDETPLSIFSGLTLECELPNNRLYKFEGAINLQEHGMLPLDTRQILLRGATLRNTDWILGVVVYTGADTKFVRNTIPGQIKVTGLERNTNILVAIVFVCQVAICVGLAAAEDKWARTNARDMYYLANDPELVNHIGPQPQEIGAQFGRFLILLNQLIPISLYVTLELVKVMQSYLIDWDTGMYHKATNTHAKARTTNLNEELGQVEYIMADKTGTLTQNIMAFVQCSVGGEVYGTVQHEGGMQAGVTRKTIHTLADDPKLIQKLGEVEKGSEDPDSKFLQAFFSHLAICHVVHPVLAKKGEEGFEEDAVLKYTGASPDEEALVQGAAHCGYELKKRADDELTVLIPGLGVQKLVIMAVLEFTSERKRMSIICRDSKGRIKLYCKGADSVIFKRLEKGQEFLIETSLNQLEDFARCGYRTMCMAERQIATIEYERWAARFRSASIALDDRDEKLAAVSETIERDMMLLGVTAVEDKLQGKVPETITLLAQAGIKVWVLTGDKLETSVSVALSCNLLADSMHLFLLSENVSKSVPQLLRSMLQEARRQRDSKLDMGSDYHSEMATVIEGSSLTVALEESNKLLLLELLKLCRSVVCCRVSPIQKAQITLLLKDHGKSVILAIGDGANDCGMIKVAQIGVGIGGREGMAAVLASDYSLTRFRYLRRLLLVHGRWSYKRNRELVLYSFYKNIVYALGNAYLAFYSGYSSQALYSSFEIATYNLIWTALPTITFAVFDKDTSDCTAENNPQLYFETQYEKRPQFFWSLVGWALCALWDSLVAFFFPLAAASVSKKDGESIGIWDLGSMIYTMALFIVNMKMVTRMHNITWFHFAALNVSTSLWLLVFFCLSFALRLSNFFPNLDGIGEEVTQSSMFWLLVVLCTVSAALPGCTLEIFRNQHAPEDFEVMMEMEHGWKDGQFFPDAPDFVEQITASVPDRRMSFKDDYEFDDYGPSPLQKEIADARSANSGDASGGESSNRSPQSQVRNEMVSAQPPAATMEMKSVTEIISLPVQETAETNGAEQLRPRRLTWREVVNDDELENLTSAEALGRDGRRRSNGFQVVTRHSDPTQVPLPLTQGPTPTQRKSIVFQQGAALLIVPGASAATRRTSPKPSATPSTVTKTDQKDGRLKAVRANLAKHADERKTLVQSVAGTVSPKKKLRKRQKIWDAVKEGTAEHDPYSIQNRPHPRARRPGGSSASGSSRRGAGGRGPASPRSSKPSTTSTAHQQQQGAPSEDPSGSKSSGPATPVHASEDGASSSAGPSAAGTEAPMPSPQNPKSGPGRSRFV